jgi:DNA-binding CsgD family transcriptional regulator
LTAVDGLLERESELAELDELLGAAVAGDGRLVLVYGEAGIGKTALLRHFCDDARSRARVLWGTCDALLTPRPFAPLLEISRAVGGSLDRELAGDAGPYDVAIAFEADLRRNAPSVVVLDDMHLADEATLDVLRLVGRRIGELAVLLVVSHRDDVLDRFDPLRVVLGDVASAAPVARVQPQRLSRAALTPLAAAHGVLPDELHRRTEGNPFYVTEVLASGNGHVPETVRDAVLARAARLQPGARRLLDAVAITAPRCELGLLRGLAGDDVGALSDAVASGIVADADGAIAFRHDLARRAIEESIGAQRTETLHRAALELLRDPVDGEPDVARLAHHAEAIGDGDLVLEFAPLAAARAAQRGAHREAAAHYRRTLPFVDRLALQERAALLAAAAAEFIVVVDFETGLSAQRAVIDAYRQLGDPVREGAATSVLAQTLWFAGRFHEALPVADAAIALLDPHPGPELVAARCTMVRLSFDAEDVAAAQRWARLADELATELGDEVSRAAALEVVGTLQYAQGDPAGLAKLEAALATARRLELPGLPVWICVVVAHVGDRIRDHDTVERFVAAGLDHCAFDDDDVWRYYLLSLRAKALLARGDWEQAQRAAEVCLGDLCVPAQISALTTIGLVRARRGEPGVWELLDEALELATPSHVIHWSAVVAAARAEAAWLEGRLGDAAAATEPAYADGAAGTPWEACLTYWQALAGLDVAAPRGGEPAFRLALEGDSTAAARRWRELGCPYEAALAALAGDDEQALRDALEELERLGADPAARLATTRLRAIGARGVARGPRIATLANPAQLTARELEVLELLSAGLRNAEIAQRLVVSERTVDHHVSAILRKLGVANRVQAAAEAARLGIGEPEPAQR